MVQWRVQRSSIRNRLSTPPCTLFWERGYEATSIQELVDATGVQRQSLYDTFGSKHEIFCEALCGIRRWRRPSRNHKEGIKAAFHSSKRSSKVVLLRRSVMLAVAFVVNCGCESWQIGRGSRREEFGSGRDGIKTCSAAVWNRHRSRGTKEFIFSFCVGAVPGQCLFRPSPHGEDATLQSDDRQRGVGHIGCSALIFLL